MAKEKQEQAMKERKEKKEAKPAETKRRVQDIVRLAETNIDGEKPVREAVRSIRGVSFMFSNAISSKIDFADKKLGELSEQEIHILEDIINGPMKSGIPEWICNRRREPLTGKSMHLSVSRLELARKTDINEMKKMKSYRGVRHILGLPVRGQRTTSGGGGKTVGVLKKKQQPAKKGK
jgi:small subunit ribosomal protein S13